MRRVVLIVTVLKTPLRTLHYLADMRRVVLIVTVLKAPS